MILCSPASLVWVKDCNQVLIIDEQRRTFHRLSDEAALVWGWLASAYSYPKIVRLLENLLKLSPEEAEKKLHSLLHAWQRAGLLEREAGEDGQPDCD